MKKIILQFIVPFIVGCAVVMAFGFPLGQALVTGICGMIGLYIGQFLSKRKQASEK